ncbi:MAG: 16S rRNA (guanine(966)-N(2))-methyltransferase RsmD [Gammaproteobacteria bacterium]|nr:16S rRNA (guanine(966)-N(2))-methyltransferase RsmD [Gammaproteobacteria bacterium]
MSKKLRKSSAGKLRIIGGMWRSRFLQVADLPGLRPTTDRVRETLFNWLQNDIPGADCLDLFAGSGALSFESASRGAASVTMIENQRQAAEVLSANIRDLKAEVMQLLQCDALNWLSKPAVRKYDVVFIDPPFDSDYLSQACELLESNQYLAEFACVYLEMNRKQDLPILPENWNVVRQKKAGQVGYYLVRRNFVSNSGPERQIV